MTALKYASHRLKKDPTLAFKAIERNGYIMQYVDDELRNDRDFALRVLAGDSGFDAFPYVGEQLRDDVEIFLACPQNIGRSATIPTKDISVAAWQAHAILQPYKNNIKAAGPSVKRNRGIILQAIACRWQTFEHAAPELRNDISIYVASRK